MKNDVKVSSPLEQFKRCDDFFLIDNTNKFAKISNAENGLKFKLYEKKEDETLWITCETALDDCGLIGSECKNNYDCQKAVDFCYIYFVSSNRKAYCHLYDLKKNIGYGENVIKHLVEQWRNSIRYVRSVCVFYSSEIEKIYFGVVAETYDEAGVARLLNDCEQQEDDIDNSRIPVMIKDNVRKNFRHNPGMLSILKLFVQKKFSFENQIYDFCCFKSANKEYYMNFLNGVLS